MSCLFLTVFNTRQGILLLKGLNNESKICLYPGDGDFAAYYRRPGSPRAEVVALEGAERDAVLAYAEPRQVAGLFFTSDKLK